MTSAKHISFFLVLLLVVAFIAGGIYVEQRVGSQMNSPFAGLPDNPGYTEGEELPKLGSMPEFEGISAWINSEALTPADLKGKVVLVDFWTYSCINCIRTFPYLRDWWTKYEDDGFVLIGVHTPEFEFEEKYENVLKATQQNDLTYPVALDNDYLTWRTYNNRYWPATYIFDRDGELRYTHHGEGDYEETEAVIQHLLNVEASMTEASIPNFEDIRSPETYFGYGRAQRFASPESMERNVSATYTSPDALALNAWALSGDWTVTEEYAQADAAQTTLRFRFDAGVANFVMEAPPNGTGTVQVWIDGVNTTTINVSASDLYEVFRGDAGEHEVELEILTPGVKIYTITFGA